MTKAALNTENSNTAPVRNSISNEIGDVLITTKMFPDADLNLLQEMMEAGIMYGHKKTKTNPRFKPYIYTTRNKIEIIDVAMTLSAIDKLVDFLKDQIKNNKIILFVATQPAAQSAVEALAKKFNMPYIRNRWIGGLLTNFKVISARIEYFKKIRSDMEKGGFEKYTKKERMVINRDIQRMREMFYGIENLTKLPDVLFVIDTNLKGHTTAVKEAKIIGIPIVGIIDSDDDPAIMDYPVPANDHAKASIEWIINRIIEGLKN